MIFFLLLLALAVYVVVSEMMDEKEKNVSLRDEINSYPGREVPDNLAHDGKKYFLHKNIVTTIFWVGEKPGFQNNFIANFSSAWDKDWKNSFGGKDDPHERDGLLPEDFTPRENPFYFALPYNDFDRNGNRKQEIFEKAPWSKEKKWNGDKSLCKNRWIRIIKDGRSAYAQWEDVGPFREDDSGYVFGDSLPANEKGARAGLDVSPATRDYLGLGEVSIVDWQFVDEEDVPDGPWKKIITESQINW